MRSKFVNNISRANITEFHYQFPGINGMVSPIGLGTVKFGRNQNVKNKSPDGFALPSDQDIIDLLTLALESGVNLIDTAPAYGLSEERLGKALSKMGVNRTSIFVCSKVGEEYQDGLSTYHFSATRVRASIERSLRRLQTDYIDSVLVHCSRNDLDELRNTDVLSELQELKTRGLIRTFGASTNSLEGGLYAVEHCDSVMVSFNCEYLSERDVIVRAKQLNKGIFIKKGLLQGHLTQLSAIDPVQECLNAIYAESTNLSVILGTLNIKHLCENINAAAMALASVKQYRR